MDKMEIQSSYYGQVRREIEGLIPENVSTVLEIGCGAGGTMQWLRGIRQIKYAAAVELVPEAADLARDIFDKVETSSFESAQFEFDCLKFDLIIALDVLEHLQDPDQAVKRLHAMATEGGVLIVSIPNIGNYSVSWPLLTKGQWNYGSEGLLDRTHLRFFSEKTANDLLKSNGFNPISRKYNWQFPNIFSVFGLRSKKWRWYSQRALMPFLSSFRHLFVLQFLIAARKQAD